MSLSVFKSGCDTLLHHLLTVQVDLPSCSASHLPVFCCSTSTTFSLFKFAMHLKLLNFGAKVIKKLEIRAKHLANVKIGIK